MCIPVGGEVREIDHADVGAEALDLLGVPEREGVVVAVGEDDAVVADGSEVVHAKVAGCVAARAVVVVPCLRDHLQGHKQSDKHGGYGCGEGQTTVGRVFGGFSGGFRFFLSEKHADERRDGRHTDADPDGEGIERSGEGVVALAGLPGGLVEIEHDGDAGHEEEEEDHPELLDAALGVAESLPEQADHAEKQREHIEDVVALVALAEFVGQERLVAETGVVDEGYA